jgi:ribosomal protein L11 methyltransferase
MVELLLLAAQGEVERLSDVLAMEAGALSVSIEDADAGTPAEQALFGEPDLPAPEEAWHRTRLAALFSDDDTAAAAAAFVLAQHWTGGVEVHAIRPVPDQDWVRLTQSQFAPVAITPDFWIVPSWHAPPAAARQVLRLDPGMAFGTGTHPTTRMCLRWIARHASDLHGARVLDYGCGSGILAIGAALFSATAIDAVDIDPAAVQSTRDNARTNQATGIRAGSPELAGTPCGAYPVVLANILATPLKLLAPLLSAHVAPGGRLVLAGILERQAEELQAAYAPTLRLEIDALDDGWILMTAQRAESGRG